MASSGDLITRKYTNLRGIDLRKGDISLNRSSNALNVYKNYKSSNIIETRPEVELLMTFDNSIYGLFFYEIGLSTQLIVHSGTKLYKVMQDGTNISKTDNIRSLFIKKDNFESEIENNSTFKWQYVNGLTWCDEVGIYSSTISNEKYIYVVRYNYDSSQEVQDRNKYWLYECFKEINGEYTLIDIEEVPDDIKGTKILTNYGKQTIDFENNLTPNSMSEGNLPNIFKTQNSKTDITPSGISMKAAKSNFFVYGGILYIKDGLNYLTYNGTTCSEVVGYIPTTSIGRKPSGGGTTYEDVNMLSSYRKNTFVGDGEATIYYLDAQNITGVTLVEVNGIAKTVGTDYSVDTTNGKVTFVQAPTAPDTDGQDNVSITYQKTVSGYADRIKKCTLLQVFDNRVFFSGNQDYPNVVWHSSLDDPTYCSDLDYYNEGQDLAKVKSMVAGNNALWVFKEPSQANTTVFYHIPTIDSEYGKIYPSSHSNIATGCIASGINFNDDIVFFSDRGMEGIKGDITSEQVVSHRSSFIDNALLNETNYKYMSLGEWEGYLMVCIDNKIYLADSRQITTLDGTYEYDWYYWELKYNGEPLNITSIHNQNNEMYIGTDKGIFTLTGEGNIESYWETPIDNFGYGNFQKITSKKGFVIECEGDIEVYAKTNTSSYQLLNTYTNVNDYVAPKIKLKKFKDCQIKIKSNKHLKLEGIVLSSYLGAFIKR